MMTIICSSHAQLIVGDMNADKKLTIEDITVLTSTVLGKTAQRIISTEGSDKTTLVGSWVGTDASHFQLKNDGTIVQSTIGGSSYEYFPNKGSLILYDKNNELLSAYQVKSVTSSCLTLREAGSKKDICFYPRSSFANSAKLSETVLNMFVGQTKDLSVAPTTEGSRLYDYTWITEDSTVAYVTQTGTVVATGVGKKCVGVQFASSGFGRALCEVNVTQAVESLTLSQTTATVLKGQSFTIAGIISPSNATNQTLTWSSSDTSIANVTQEGKVTVGNNLGTATITAKTTDGTNLSATCKVTVMDAKPTSLSLDCLATTMEANSTLQLNARIKPSDLRLTPVWTSSDETLATVDETGKVTAKSKAGHVYIKATIPGTDLEAYCSLSIEYACVDLGLSVKWATMNVGANSPEEYGKYYAWGETKAYDEEDTSNTHNYSYNSKNSYTKTYYYWDTYMWCSGTTMKTLTKYNTRSEYGKVDKKTTLDFADDAAYVNWGASWRMPTGDEMMELIDNCTWEWTTMNGVNGYKVISKKDTSKFIFLPAACNRYENVFGSIGYVGDYWSSSLSESFPCYAWYLYFKKEEVSCSHGTYRFRGCTIRPVRR